MSENVVQPGIEPGSPDYRSDALTTRPLNQPRMLRVLYIYICIYYTTTHAIYIYMFLAEQHFHSFP